MLTVVCLVSLPVNGCLKRREKGCNGTPTRVKTLNSSTDNVVECERGKIE